MTATKSKQRVRTAIKYAPKVCIKFAKDAYRLFEITLMIALTIKMSKAKSGKAGNEPLISSLLRVICIDIDISKMTNISQPQKDVKFVNSALIILNADKNTLKEKPYLDVDIILLI